MTLHRPCLKCGEPVAGASWCPEHKPQPTKSRRDRGYEGQWRKISARARRKQPWCSDCGTVEDLTADHTPESWEAHDAGKPITLDLVDVVCRPCNSRRGHIRGDNPGWTSPAPVGKAHRRSQYVGEPE